MKRLQPTLLSLLLCATAGCSLAPVYQQPAPSVPAAFPQGEAYRDNSAADPQAKAAGDTSWRDFLADPRMVRLVELALANNRDLRVAALNVEKVRAQYQIQRAALLPDLNATAGSSATRTPASLASSHNTTIAHSYSTGLSASWEIDFFGRLQNLSQAALEQYLASGYARHATELLLVSQVADQYLMLLAYDEQLALTESTAKNAASAYQIVQLQFDNGIASELELRQSQTVVEQAAVNHAAQVRARAQALNALVLLIGQDLPADLPAPMTLGQQHLMADIPAGLPADLLLRRPDILQAEAVLRSENASIGAARAAFFPSIKLTGSAGSSSATLGGLFAAGSGAWSLAPSLSLPIFDGGNLRAGLDLAQVQKDIGVAQYQKAVQTAFREVADGLAARGTYDQQLAAQQRYTQAQQRRLDLAQLLYKSGTDAYLSVLTAQTDLYSAQQTLITTRLNRLTGLVDLFRALGGGWLNADVAASEPGVPGRLP